MTSASRIEDGLYDEALAANLFHGLGYFTRTRVQIYPVDTKQQASDIDVFAIRFDRHLVPTINLVEVKKESNRIADLFKLYGLRTYYGNCEAYFISGNIHDITVDIAKSLGIKAMHFQKLRELTSSDKKREIVDLTASEVQTTIDFLKTMRDTDAGELYWKYHYLWLQRNPYTRFFHLQRLFETSRTFKETKLEPSLKWYRSEVFILSMLALIEIASDNIDLQLAKIQDYVESKFYGIGTPKEGKMKIKKGLDIIMAELKKLDKELVLPELEVLPPYVDKLIQLVRVLTKNAPFAQSYLIVNETIHRYNLRGVSRNLKHLAASTAQYEQLRILNQILLEILHGGTIGPDFNDFV